MSKLPWVWVSFRGSFCLKIDSTFSKWRKKIGKPCLISMSQKINTIIDFFRYNCRSSPVIGARNFSSQLFGFGFSARKTENKKKGEEKKPIKKASLPPKNLNSLLKKLLDALLDHQLFSSNSCSLLKTLSQLMANMNKEVLKQPRGFIKLVQWVSKIGNRNWERGRNIMKRKRSFS